MRWWLAPVVAGAFWLGTEAQFFAMLYGSSCGSIATGMFVGSLFIALSRRKQ